MIAVERAPLSLNGDGSANVPLLEAASVTKAFNGVPALRNGQFKLMPGSVHALCGGNGAGKSTFLSIIMGILRKDSGFISVSGNEVDFRTPNEALNSRIAIITQELEPIPEMTVAENIFLGREPRRAGIFVDRKQMNAMAQNLLEGLQFEVDATFSMSRLSLAQIQLVEIAKAFSYGARIVIMDEPTSAIGEHEVGIMFDAIRSMTKRGVGIIYVTHRLSEIFEIADSFTVFRDGEFIETGLISDIDRPSLVRLIVGHDVSRQRRQTELGTRSPVLVVDNLTRLGEFEGISLTVAQGEILGVYGLMGSGRTEFLDAVYGISVPDAGSIHLMGKKIPAGRPSQSIAAGMAMVTEDRKDSGLILSSSIGHNISLSVIRRLSWHGLIRRGPEIDLVRSMKDRLAIRAASMTLDVAKLSGGNQQKVVLARCLSTNPILLICDEPTRGIDEGAKQEIYHLLGNFVEQGGAVLLVSSEAQEILQVTDRIAIFNKGRLTEIVDATTADSRALLHLAA